jgi:hypothetical protein
MASGVTRTGDDVTAPTRIQPRGYTWSAALARYRAPNGRIVSTAQVRAAIDGSIDAYRESARSLAEQLRAGGISLRAWEAEMRVVVKDSQLLGAASAAGGWAQLDQRSLGRAGRAIRDQYAFLDRFASDVMTGRQKLDGSLTNRAVMYVEAARAAYEREREAIEIAAGYDEERNIRHASDSCEGCIREERRGWVAIGALVPIGDRNCLTRCRCEIERRMSTPRRRSRRGPSTTRQRERALIGT